MILERCSSVRCGWLGLACVLALASSLAAQDQVILEGRALDVRSEPVARALVEILRPESRFSLLSRYLAGESEPPALAQTRTDAEGAFRLAAPGDGPWTVVVSAPGKLPQVHTVQPLPLRQMLPAAILPEAAVEQVDLPGPAGAPAAGAWIEVERRVQPESLQRYARVTGWRSEPILGVADERGSFSFVRGRDELLVLRARLPDATLRVQLGAGASPVVDQAYSRRSESRDFRFLLADGRPCSAALILVDGRLVGATDEDGRIALDVTQRSEVEVLSPQGDRQAWSLSGFARLPTDGDLVLQLSLPPQKRVQIVDPEGRPLQQAIAVVEARSSRADADGFVRALWRHRGRSDVWVSAPGFVPRRLDREESRADAWRLEPAAEVRGLVVGPGNRPLPGIDLRISPLSQGGLPTGWARSDSLGRFSVEGLPERGYFTVKSAWRRQGVGESSFRAGRSERLRLVLSRERTVAGRVVAEGSPLPQATVSLRLSSLGTREARTDSEGRFVLPAAAGDAVLEAKLDGYAGYLERLEIPEGEGDFELGDLEMPSGAAVDVLVLAQDVRDPLSEARILLVARRPLPTEVLDSRGDALERRPLTFYAARETHELDALTDLEGMATFRGLPEDAFFDLRIERHGYRSLEVEGLERPESGVFELLLAPALSISGRVVDVQGEPIREAFVGITSLDGLTTPDLDHPYTDAEGIFVIDGLVEGSYRVWARAADHAAFEPVAVDLGDAPVEELVVREAPSAVLTGRVIDDDGRALSDVRVVVAEQLATTDSVGEFVLVGVAVGRQEAQMRAPDGRGDTQVVDVDPGGSYVELRLGPLRVSGRVVDGSGRPVAGARVSLQGASSSEETVTDESGSFRLALIQGAARLTAEAGDLRGEADVSYFRQSVDGVEIRIESGARLAGLVAGLESERTVRVRLERDGRTQWSDVDEEGLFLFERVSPGAWQLSVLEAARGSMSTRVLASQRVEVPRSGDQYVELVAGRGRGAGTGSLLQGRLLVDDSPAAAVHLTLVGAGGSHWSRTDLDGRFAFDDVPDGEYVLYSGEPGGGLASVASLRLPAPFLEARLRRARLHVEVVDALTGESLDGTVELLSDAPPRQLELAGGVLRREVLVRGVPRLRVVAPGYEAVEVPVPGDHRLALRRSPGNG